MNERISFGTFVILLLVIAIQGTQLLFSNVQLRREQVEIARQFEVQTPQIESAEQLRRQFEGIAGAVAKLADEGNQNAATVRDQLAAQGISLRTDESR
jgi:hypothetical protein